MATEKRIVGGFQVDSKLLDATDKLAEETDRSRSAIVRLALREFIERREMVANKQLAEGQLDTAG